MIPTSSNYPNEFDDNQNLFEVHDSLRLRLVEDYNPGDTSIIAEGDPNIVAKFPTSGKITLTEQCSDIDLRAISFYYSSLKIDENNFGLVTFLGLEKYPQFTDTSKMKRVTHVTQNVMAEDHNSIKDAIIATQEFVGVKDTVDKNPFGNTMEGRINFLRNLVLKPRAWFTANKRIGIVPFTVVFRDLSFRNPTSWQWDFGDSPISGIVDDPDGGTISKTYYTPGVYDVALTVGNNYGEDEIVFPEFITAKVPAPDEATISFVLADNQLEKSPGIKARADTLISMIVTDNGENVLDPITTYEWKLPGDDLVHPNIDNTTATYSVGGIYDVKLKVKTRYKSYRITTFEDYIDIIEKVNLWYMGFNTQMDFSSTNYTKTAYAYEFGLLSETFKQTEGAGVSVKRDHSFINSTTPEKDRQRYEFIKNNGFAPLTNHGSGNSADSLVFWSEGGPTLASHKIAFKEFQGFTNVWSNPIGLTSITRPWNWISFASSSKSYIALGNTDNPITGVSATNMTKTTINLETLVTSDTTMTTSNFKNGATDLQFNVGNGNNGHFSVYRTCWRGSQGFIARNESAGVFFRIKDFYKTEGVLSNPFVDIRKLPDIPGNVKLEGQIVALTSGVYFFNNTGEISAYNPDTNVWTTGGPALSTSAFKALQDTTIDGFDDESNTLLATSDGDRRAYISFDYSPNTFIKFNEADLSFTSLISRPSGEQWQLRVY